MESQPEEKVGVCQVCIEVIIDLIGDSPALVFLLRFVGGEDGFKIEAVARSIRYAEVGQFR